LWDAVAWCVPEWCDAVLWCALDLCGEAVLVVVAEAADVASTATGSARPKVARRERREVITAELHGGAACRAEARLRPWDRIRP